MSNTPHTQNATTPKTPAPVSPNTPKVDTSTHKDAPIVPKSPDAMKQGDTKHSDTKSHKA